MSDRIPFRDMRQRLAATKAEAALLLGMESLTWAKDEYAMFMIIGEMSNKTPNPTYAQMQMLVGVWLRFYKRLIERLPDGHILREKCQVEFDKLAVGYEEVVK